MTTFMEKLQARWDEGKFVCIGLDSDYTKIPPHVHTLGRVDSTLFDFNRAIVEATHDLVCAYKPNTAFYEKHGAWGIEALIRTIAFIHQHAPDVPVILDAKRADIGSTNEGYATFAFDRCVADAITVHPYLGSKAMKPFLDRADKGVIVLCRTSNPGAGEFQDLTVNIGEEAAIRWGLATKRVNTVEWPGLSLSEAVAHSVTQDWNYNGNCAVVVGATYPEELAQVRQIVGAMPILIPGIGAQGGDLEATVKAGANSRGQGMIINNSRGIIFASPGENFADAARAATILMHEKVAAVQTAV